MTYEFFPEVDQENMDRSFMRNLIRLRRNFGRPMVITSHFRTPEHNAKVGGSTHSAHLEGRAVDVSVSGPDAYRLAKMAFQHGFTGVGIKQHGAYPSRFIHLDDCQNSDERPRPRLWTYR